MSAPSHHCPSARPQIMSALDFFLKHRLLAVSSLGFGPANGH